MTALQEAQAALETAESRLGAAEFQAKEFEAAIAEKAAAAGVVEQRIRALHKAGDPVPDDLRQEHRNLLADVSSMEAERAILDEIVSERTADVAPARVAVALARLDQLRAEAEALGGEVHQAIDQLRTVWGQLKALDAAGGRELSTLRSGGYAGPLPGGLMAVAGMEPLKRDIGDLLSNPNAARKTS